MNTHTTGRGVALVAGVLATAGALVILLQDAIRSGDWTIEHGLIPVLMAVQILTGHLFVTAARQHKSLPALGFLLVAIVATWGVLDTSVGKQAAVQAEATAKAEDVNGRRAALERAIADAEAMLGPCPAGSPATHFGNRCGLRAAVVAECASGNGKRCQGKTASQTLYEGALRTHRQDLATIGPAQPVDARSENMATLIAALTGGDKTKIKHVLATVRPFTYALIFELAALVSFGFAFGHRTHRPAQRDTAQTSFAMVAAPAPTPPKGPRKRKPAAPQPANVVAFPHPVVKALEANGGTVASNQELASLMGVTEGEASKRVDEVRHLLDVRRVGKRREISLKAVRAVA